MRPSHILSNKKTKTKNTFKERSWRLVDLSDIWSQSDEKTWTDKKTKTFWKRFSRLVTISDNWKQKPETLIVILQRDKGQHSPFLRCFTLLFNKRRQKWQNFGEMLNLDNRVHANVLHKFLAHWNLAPCHKCHNQPNENDHRPCHYSGKIRILKVRCLRK